MYERTQDGARFTILETTREYALERLAESGEAEGHPEQAARLLGALEILRESVSRSPITNITNHEYERISASVRSALGEEAFKAAYATGREMTLEQAIAYALKGYREDEVHSR